MSTVAEPLHIALYDALVGDSALAAIVGTRVFDTLASRETVFPYITIDSPTEGAFNGFARRGNENSLNINIWSREIGTRQVYQINACIERILNEQRLTLASGTQYRATTRLVVVGLDPDGVTMHGVVRYQSQSRA